MTNVIVKRSPLIFYCLKNMKTRPSLRTYKLNALGILMNTSIISVQATDD